MSNSVLEDFKYRKVIFVNQKQTDVTIDVTAVWLGSVFHRGKVNLYIANTTINPPKSRLAVCGLSILSFKKTYHFGTITVKPSESVVVCSHRSNLDYTVVVKEDWSDTLG